MPERIACIQADASVFTVWSTFMALSQQAVNYNLLSQPSYAHVDTLLPRVDILILRQSLCACFTHTYTVFKHPGFCF